MPDSSDDEPDDVVEYYDEERRAAPVGSSAQGLLLWKLREPHASKKKSARPTGQALKRTQVQAMLQKAASACGLPAERFMSHSLRIGGASALFQATGEMEVVKRTGRWSSAAVQRYLHDGEVALCFTAKKMASVQQKVHYT